MARPHAAVADAPGRPAGPAQRSARPRARPRSNSPTPTPLPSSPASRRAHSADRSSRCSRPSPPSSSPAERRASNRRRSSRSSGSMPRITTGRKIAKCTVLDSDLPAAHHHAPAPEGAGERAGRRPARWTPASSSASTSSPPRSAQTEFSEWLMSGLRDGLPAGHRHGRRVRALARDAARTASDWWSSTRPIRQPSRSSPTSSRASLRDRRPHGHARGGRGRRDCGSRTSARRSIPQPDSVALFISMGPERGPTLADVAAADSPPRRPFVAGENTFTVDALTEQASDVTEALQPERAAPSARAGHALSDDLLRRRTERARVSRDSFATSTRASACRCRWSTRARPRRSSTPRPRASSRKYDVPLERFQPQDESALNRLLESQLPQSVEQAMRGGRERLAAQPWSA